MANRAQRRKQERLAAWEAEKARQKQLTGLYEQISYDNAPGKAYKKRRELDFIKRTKEKAEAQQKWLDEHGLFRGQYESSSGSEKTKSAYSHGDKYEIVKSYWEMVDAGVIKPTVHFDRYQDVVDWMEENMDIEVMSELIDEGTEKQRELDEREAIKKKEIDWGF